ncbi:ABC transporter ATP-binding protein [Candidatus Woesearchaeota archaeon]|nr:ABC transporter ATP-binding protein [Candidatus Woesearchaeota archaeon]
MKNKNKKGEVDLKYNLKLYFEFLREYKLLFFLLLLFLLVIETTLVIDKFIFKILIDKGIEFSSDIISRSEFISILIALALGFIAIVIIRVIGKWVEVHILSLLETNLMLDLKRRFFNHITGLSHEFHTTHKTGSLISRLIRGSGAIERMTDVLIWNLTPLIIQLVLVIPSVAYFDLQTAIVLILMTIVFIIYSLFMNKRQQLDQIKENKAEDFEKSQISDIFTNIDSIKYFGKEESIKRKYGKISEITRQAIRRSFNHYRWLDSGHTLILGISIFFLIYFPIRGFLEGTITIGAITFIYTIYGNIVNQLFGFVNGIKGFYRSMADFESLFQYNKIDNSVKDIEGAKELKIKQGIIEFKEVSFKYHNRKILKNFSLTIPENKKVALVGPSGAGKSTIVKLLYRLYDLEKGEILIDGKNIKEFKQESLRSELSIVPQECILFDDTIYNNIAFSKSGATREEVFQAIKFAQLDKIIKNFPNKEKTIVGERGVRLSGGEKQRVSIARAILANKRILVLDEATSALDSETEHQIQRDLENLMQGRTSIIIAHRLSTIMKCDFIVVLSEGKIIEVDTHDNLVKKKGTYQKLWHLQKGGYLE